MVGFLTASRPNISPLISDPAWSMGGCVGHLTLGITIIASPGRPGVEDRVTRDRVFGEEYWNYFTV